MFRSPNFFASIIPTLALLIVCFQAYRVVNYDQCAWKGGGFGMFSSSDNPGMRHIRLAIKVDGAWNVYAPPDAAIDEEFELRILPNKKNMLAYLDTVTSLSWGKTDSNNIVWSVDDYWGPNIKPVELEGVKVAFIKTTLDDQTGQLMARQTLGYEKNLDNASATPGAAQ